MNNTYNKKNGRRKFIKESGAGGLLALAGINGLMFGQIPSALGSDIKKNVSHKILPKPDHVLRSFPENMVWGYFGADVPPKISIKDGQVIEIHTVSTSGISREDPESFFKENNLPIDDHAKELFEIIEKVPREPSGIRGHMLTGPVYIEGAEPGDTMEIRIFDVRLRSGYGVNHVNPGSGGIPDHVKERKSFVYKYTEDMTTAILTDGVEIPLKPFMGVMALSPPPETGRVSSIPPGVFGGNFDLKHLIKGTTLYLPVSVKGGLFTTGDAHGAQGNGEVSGTAIETSMILLAQFIVHKGESLKMPWAETPDHFIVFGLDPDLDNAMEQALLESVKFIQEKLGFTFGEALSISSTAVDFEVTQVVDRTEGVHGLIPKSIFKKKTFDYWY